MKFLYLALCIAWVGCPALAATQSLALRIASSADDAEEYATGLVNLTSPDLELVADTSVQTIGLRFANILIPQGATITNAHVQFEVDEASTEATDLSVWGEAADSASPFASVSWNVSSRLRTSASVLWNPAVWPVINAAGVDQQTPGLAPVIQEIVDRAGWASGNALALIIAGSGRRVAKSYEGGVTWAPVLHIEWTPGADDTTRPTVSISNPASGATLSGVVTIHASAADNTGVRSVQFRLGGSKRCRIDRAPPYACAIDTRFETNGTAALSAVATDLFGNRRVSPVINVNISNNKPPRAGTVRVPEGYATIQAAIDAVETGGTVLVGPGNYNGSLAIAGKSITLASYFHQTGDRSFIDATTLSGEMVTLDVSAPNVTVKGLRFAGGVDSLVFRAPGGRALSNKFEYASLDALSFEDTGGMARGNSCTRPGDDCIDADGPISDVLIASNVMDTPNDDGIEIRNEPHTGALVTVTIRGNTITGAKEDGIQLIDFPAVQNRRFVIERNVIRKSDKVGLGIMDNGETVEDFSGGNMPERVHVFNNTFDANNYAITGGDNLIAVNNIISRSTTLGLKNTDAISIVANTLFWSNSLDHSGANMDLATTISGDPLYTLEFGPGAGSPAIDAGAATYTHNNETVLSIQPSTFGGAAPDLGRFEFSP